MKGTTLPIIFGITFFLLSSAKITTSNSIQQYEIPDGGKDELSCRIDNINATFISWKVFGEVVEESVNSAHSNFKVSENSSLIVTNPRNGSLQGVINVTCIASTNNTNSSRIYQVVLYKAPKILTAQQDIAVPVPSLDKDHRIMISCRTIGYPKPFINWVFDDMKLNSTRGPLVGRDDLQGFIIYTYQVFENGSLLIFHPKFIENIEHSNFTCVASSFVGEDRQSHFLFVGGAQTFSFDIILANASQFMNRKATEEKIKTVLDDSFSLHSINVVDVNLISGFVRFEITWFEKHLMEEGYLGDNDILYTAKIAKNIHDNLVENGVAVRSFIMDATPGPATELKVVDVGKNEISFSWRKPSFFNVTKYQIEINEGSNWKNFKTVDGDKTSTVIDELEPDTKYRIRLKSENNKGVGQPSFVVETETDSDNNPPVEIIAAVVVLVVLVLIAVVLGIRYYRRKPPEIVVIPLSDNPYLTSLPGIDRGNVYVRDDRTFCAIDGDIQADASPDDKEYFSWLEISRESLILGDTLGSGEFGLVVKAVWLNEKNNTPVPVAVKTIKDNATEDDRKELFKELKLMADIGEHSNIVKMIGACSNGGPLWIVVELCENGNLLSFLRNNRRDTSERTGEVASSLDPLLRVRFAFDVSKGMKYLESMKIVHRDLAARNVLLGKNKIAKIADFGLSRDIYEQGTYTKKDGGKLPVKWMAIESLTDLVYNSKTDVWSFGVLFWEIECAGMVPYTGINSRLLREHLLNGFRLEKPSETAFEIYDLMIKCWEANPDDRPNFREIELNLETYLEERTGYLPVTMDESPADEEGAYLNYMMEIEDEEATSTTSL